LADKVGLNIRYPPIADGEEFRSPEDADLA
jgi:hypothetical protein